MLNWLKQKIFKSKKKNNNGSCEQCIWWKAEEANGKIIIGKNARLCDINKKYTTGRYSCNEFLEERFEATEDSIQTPELEINHDLSIEENDTN